MKIPPIPEFLEAFDSNILVSYRIFDTKEQIDQYQIHDKVLHHVCFAGNVDMAQFVTDSINFIHQNSLSPRGNPPVLSAPPGGQLKFKTFKEGWAEFLKCIKGQ